MPLLFIAFIYRLIFALYCRPAHATLMPLRRADFRLPASLSPMPPITTTPSLSPPPSSFFFDWLASCRYAAASPCRH